MCDGDTDNACQCAACIEVNYRRDGRVGESDDIIGMELRNKGYGHRGIENTIANTCCCHKA